jgi:hypothetical protein
MVTPNITTTNAIPAWAIVMCILTIWICLLGLLFLLAKEQRTSGYVQVSVQANGFYYATQVPVNGPGVMGEIEGRVNYVRSLAAQAGPGEPRPF